MRMSDKFTDVEINNDEVDPFFRMMAEGKVTFDETVDFLTKNKLNSESIRFIPEQYMTPELVTALFERDPMNAFAHFNDFSKTQDMCDKAVAMKKSNYKYVPNKFANESMTLGVIGISAENLMGKSHPSIFTKAVIDKLASLTPNSLRVVPQELIDESAIMSSFKHHGSFPADTKIPISTLVGAMNKICENREEYMQTRAHTSSIRSWEVGSKIISSNIGDMDSLIEYVENSRTSDMNKAIAIHGKGLDDLDVAQQYAANPKIMGTALMVIMDQIHGDQALKSKPNKESAMSYGG